MTAEATQAPAHLPLAAAAIGTLELEGVEMPYANLEDAPYVHSRIVLDGTEYAYVRSFPVRGHSAVMPGAVRELLGQGKRLLVAERGERYYVYAA